MNRLIIIGNGFDLAHNLPTSYRSFINFIWKNYHNLNTIPQIRKLFKSDSQIHDTSTGLPMKFNDYKDFHSKLIALFSGSGNYKLTASDHGNKTFKIYTIDPFGRNEPVIFFDYKNKFFELITVQNAENWVDIENTYYQVLVSLLKSEQNYKYIGSVERLNEEFEEIKELLEYYLFDSIEGRYDFKDQENKLSNITSIFEYKYKRLKDSENMDNSYFLEFPAEFRQKLIDFDSMFSISSHGSSYFFENLFLDFNYTSTISSYISKLNNSRIRRKNYGISSHIQIHGKLNDFSNPINFGFGDEMDDNYKILEKANDNNYLENIKSFMYLNNSNYKKLLNWIESNDYQVFIMGHSCGLSDRTMLNTIFEHNNCKSIKIFYHEKEDGTDNFKDLSQNLSRHFNKKTLMRTKVVDKSLSKALPQDVRFPKIL